MTRTKSRDTAAKPSQLDETKPETGPVEGRPSWSDLVVERPSMQSALLGAEAPQPAPEPDTKP